MDGSYDIAIIGAGLAGAFAAFNLSRHHRVVVVEMESSVSGASAVGAGLVNPFMARKANPIWRWREALDALEETVSETDRPDLFQIGGILRPVFDAGQADWFKDASTTYPESCSWLERDEIRTRWPAVAADGGGLLIHRGGSIDQRQLVDALLDGAREQGCDVARGVTALRHSESRANVSVAHRDGTIVADKALFCVGADFHDWPVLAHLNLHPLKGQTITVERPLELDGELICLSGSGYVVPSSGSLVLGSTYHHKFSNREASAADTLEILNKVKRMLPKLGEPTIESEAAGVRVTVPVTRLPVVGPVSPSGRSWVLTGLGSKGILMGALIGRDLPGYMDNPETIHPEIRVS